LNNDVKMVFELKKSLIDLKDNKGAVIPALQIVQERFGYLPKWAIELVAKMFNVPLSEVYGVATFYSQFRLQPKGMYLIKICSGTACHVRGAAELYKDITEILGIKSGETTKDGLFSLEKVACLGACGLAPAMVINDEVYGRVTKDKLDEILHTFKKGGITHE